MKSFMVKQSGSCLQLSFQLNVSEMVALFTCTLFLVSSLPKVSPVVVEQKSAVSRQYKEFLSYAKFIQHSNHSLGGVEKIASFLVEKQSECPFSCINEPRCYSCNTASHPDLAGSYLCELLATDKYRAKTKFQPNSSFHHYSLWVSVVAITLFSSFFLVFVNFNYKRAPTPDSNQQR